MRSSAGQTLIEFALVMPVFLLLLLGVLDLGRIAYAFNTISYAARNSARYGIVHPTPSSTIQAVATQTMPGLDLSQTTVTVTYPDSASYSGARLQVDVVYRFYAATPLVRPLLGGGPLVLEAISTMYIE